MIGMPYYFSKRTLDDTPLGREPQPVWTWRSVNRLGNGRVTLQANSRLSYPDISGIRCTNVLATF